MVAVTPELVELHTAYMFEEYGELDSDYLFVNLWGGRRGQAMTYATAELRRDSDELEFAGPHCNLRDIDLGIAVGSAAKTAALHSIDCRCQTRIAVAARKLGVIRADVAVALSLSLTHKAVGFDRRFPEVDFNALDPPSAGVLPIGAEGGARQEVIRNRQQPRHRLRSEG